MWSARSSKSTFFNDSFFIEFIKDVQSLKFAYNTMLAQTAVHLKAKENVYRKEIAKYEKLVGIQKRVNELTSGDNGPIDDEQREFVTKYAGKWKNSDEKRKLKLNISNSDITTQVENALKATEGPRKEYMAQFKNYTSMEEQLNTRGRRLDQARKNQIENACLTGFDDIQALRSVEDVSIYVCISKMRFV